MTYRHFPKPADIIHAPLGRANTPNKSHAMKPEFSADLLGYIYECCTTAAATGSAATHAIQQCQMPPLATAHQTPAVTMALTSHLCYRCNTSVLQAGARLCGDVMVHTSWPSALCTTTAAHTAGVASHSTLLMHRVCWLLTRVDRSSTHQAALNTATTRITTKRLTSTRHTDSVLQQLMRQKQHA
jgi:hypothetical protein